MSIAKKENSISEAGEGKRQYVSKELKTVIIEG